MPRQRKKLRKRYKVKGEKRSYTKPSQQMELQPPPTPHMADLGDPRVRQIQKITRADYKEAKQIATLEVNNPNSTLPELVAQNWLNATHQTYVSQAALFGGRRQRGGIIPDFMVRSGTGWVAWLVNGDYYHSSGFQQRHLQHGRDTATKLRLEGSSMHGIPIDKVVMMQESRVYDSRPLIFELGMLGEEVK